MSVITQGLGLDGSLIVQGFNLSTVTVTPTVTGYDIGIRYDPKKKPVRIRITIPIRGVALRRIERVGLLIGYALVPVACALTLTGKVLQTVEKLIRVGGQKIQLAESKLRIAGKTVKRVYRILCLKED